MFEIAVLLISSKITFIVSDKSSFNLSKIAFSCSATSLCVINLFNEFVI